MDSETGARADYRRAVRGFTALVADLAPDDWARPGLGVWSVRDLTGHTSRALSTVVAYLDTTGRADDPDLAGAADYYGATRAVLADPDAVAERGRQAGAALGEDPASAVARLADQVLALVDAQPDGALVVTPVGTMTLIGYLPSRTFELVVHSLDLCHAAGRTPPREITETAPVCAALAVGMAAAQGTSVDLLRALTGRAALPVGFTVV